MGAELDVRSLVFDVADDPGALPFGPPERDERACLSELLEAERVFVDARAREADAEATYRAARAHTSRALDKLLSVRARLVGDGSAALWRAALYAIQKIYARSLPCGHTVGDLVGDGAGIRCGGCEQERAAVDHARGLVP